VKNGSTIDFVGLPADSDYKSTAKEVLQARYGVR
jgi:hypothetical protein